MTPVAERSAVTSDCWTLGPPIVMAVVRVRKISINETTRKALFGSSLSFALLCPLHLHWPLAVEMLAALQDAQM